MRFFQRHWYDTGGLLSLLVITSLLMFHGALTPFRILLWLHLVSLFFHQLKEYQIAGAFPGMANTAVYKSELPTTIRSTQNRRFA